MIPSAGLVEYTFDLPFPNAQSYVWIGFVRQNDINVDFSILDRNSNLEIFKSRDKGEYLAKLYFYKKERLKFSFLNPSGDKVIFCFLIISGIKNANFVQVHVL